MLLLNKTTPKANDSRKIENEVTGGKTNCRRFAKIQETTA
jgi:hypothetical protein